MVLRKFLVIVLAMLQLVAPLVHAHAGADKFGHGLHVPGLELYRTNKDAINLQTVNAGHDAEGLLVVVNAGIKNPKIVLAELDKHKFAFLPIAQLVADNVTLIEHQCNFSPHAALVNIQYSLSPQSPRAPPLT